MNYKEIAQKSISLQAKALLDLTENLDDSFDVIVSSILETKGRVILCGVGKSGIVARKISSVFSSIGCPSFFVHANEASHGDLGSITDKDIVIMLSNSGDTKELVDVLVYCKRRGVKVFGMVGKKDSALYSASTACLLLPKFSEISNKIRFPTTSATMMSVLGDALALCVSHTKNISLEQYRSFHPGGNIGNSLMSVEGIMRKGDELPVVGEGTKVQDALILMSEKATGCLVIISEDKSVLGMITDGDLRRNIKKDFNESYVEDFMSVTPKSVSAKMLAIDALKIMNDQSIMQLVVVDEDQRIQGVIHMHDCLRVGLKARCE
jgi:arabinose-5-phosphate isomerase